MHKIRRYINDKAVEGMDRATATIHSEEDTTVYMVSYKDTETDEEINDKKGLRRKNSPLLNK